MKTWMCSLKQHLWWHRVCMNVYALTKISLNDKICKFSSSSWGQCSWTSTCFGSTGSVQWLCQQLSALADTASLCGCLNVTIPSQLRSCLKGHCTPLPAEQIKLHQLLTSGDCKHVSRSKLLSILIMFIIMKWQSGSDDTIWERNLRQFETLAGLGLFY